MGRPKFPRRDKNDSIVKEGVLLFKEWCREHETPNITIGLNDLSPLGGAIDYLVHINHVTLGFEVKVNEKSHKTKGEKAWVGPRFYVTNTSQVFFILVKYLQYVLITRELADQVMSETLKTVSTIGKGEKNGSNKG